MWQRTVTAVVIAVGVCSCSSASGHDSAPSRSPSVSSAPPPAPTTPTATVTQSPSGPPTAAGFRPSDVTFVSDQDGWVIGQHHIRRTTDGGTTWDQLSTAAPRRTNHLRFASTEVGYAWRPGGSLWLTTDAAHSWQPGGLGQVQSVEISAGVAWAIAGPLPGAGVWRGAVGSNQWSKLGTTPNRTATLDVHGAIAYLTGQQGAGPVAPALAVWTTSDSDPQSRNLPCPNHQVVPVAPLGVSTDGTVFLDCNVERQNEAGHEVQRAFTSRDVGRTWVRAPAPPHPPYDVTAIRDAVFAWNRDLYVDRGGTWQVGLKPSGSGHFVLVGFENDSHGVALTSRGTLYVTNDGGRGWQAVRF